MSDEKDTITTQVVTWSTPRGELIDITPDQERRLSQLGIWPRGRTGEEYCQVHHGLHDGPATPDEELGL